MPSLYTGCESFLFPGRRFFFGRLSRLPLSASLQQSQQRAFTSLKLPKIPSGLAVESGGTAFHGLTSGAPAI